MFEYHTLNDLIKLSADNNLEIWEIIQQADMYENDRSESDSFNMMKEMYVAMKNADSTYDGRTILKAFLTHSLISLQSSQSSVLVISRL